MASSLEDCLKYAKNSADSFVDNYRTIHETNPFIATGLLAELLTELELLPEYEKAVNLKNFSKEKETPNEVFELPHTPHIPINSDSPY